MTEASRNSRIAEDRYQLCNKSLVNLLNSEHNKQYHIDRTSILYNSIIAQVLEVIHIPMAKCMSHSTYTTFSSSVTTYLPVKLKSSKFLWLNIFESDRFTQSIHKASENRLTQRFLPRLLPCGAVEPG